MYIVTHTVINGVYFLCSDKTKTVWQQRIKIIRSPLSLDN